MNKADLITIRDYLPEDKNFILATWLRGLYYGDSWFSEVKKHTFMQVYHLVLNVLLEKPNNYVKVACLKEDPSVIMGYAILSKDPKAIHWVFIKKSWRNIGLAKDLIPKDYTTVTHLTKTGLSIIKKKNWSFNPFLI
jgi:hypothetical protein